MSNLFKLIKDDNVVCKKCYDIFICVENYFDFGNFNIKRLLL